MTKYLLMLDGFYMLFCVVIYCNTFAQVIIAVEYMSVKSESSVFVHLEVL